MAVEQFVSSDRRPSWSQEAGNRHRKKGRVLQRSGLASLIYSRELLQTPSATHLSQSNDESPCLSGCWCVCSIQLKPQGLEPGSRQANSHRTQTADSNLKHTIPRLKPQYPELCNLSRTAATAQIWLSELSQQAGEQQGRTHRCSHIYIFFHASYLSRYIIPGQETLGGHSCFGWPCKGQDLLELLPEAWDSNDGGFRV